MAVVDCKMTLTWMEDSAGSKLLSALQRNIIIIVIIIVYVCLSIVKEVEYYTIQPSRDGCSSAATAAGALAAEYCEIFCLSVSFNMPREVSSRVALKYASISMLTELMEKNMNTPRKLTLLKEE